MILNKKAARPASSTLMRTANLAPAAGPPVPKAATDRIATNAERANIVAELQANFEKKAREDLKAEQVAAKANEKDDDDDSIVIL